jgi:hypothetical protein
VRLSGFKQGNPPSETKTKSSDKMKTQYTAIEHINSNRAQNRLRSDINLQMAYNKGDRSMLCSVQLVRVPGTRRCEVLRAQRAAKKAALAI